MKTSDKQQLVKTHDLTFQPFISAEVVAERVLELGAILSQQYAGKKPLMIAVLNGSFVFAADLMRACEMDCEISFVKLSSYKGTGSSGKVTNVIGLDGNIKGKDIIVIEDIIDSGQTMIYFLETLSKMEPSSISVVTLLLKPEAFCDRFPVDLIGFEIPNKFVIGYGLDYNGLGRNYKDIYQLHQPS